MNQLSIMIMECHIVVDFYHYFSESDLSQTHKLGTFVAQNDDEKITFFERQNVDVNETTKMLWRPMRLLGIHDKPPEALNNS